MAPLHPLYDLSNLAEGFPVQMAIIFGVSIYLKKSHTIELVVSFTKRLQVHGFLHPQIAFLGAAGLNMFFTDTLKTFAGRKRPNFFALCNYKNYLGYLNGSKLLLLISKRLITM